MKGEVRVGDVKERDKLELIFGELESSKSVMHKQHLISKVKRLVAGENVGEVIVELEGALNVGAGRLLQLARLAVKHEDKSALEVVALKATLLFLKKIAKSPALKGFEMKHFEKLMNLAGEAVKADRKLVLVKKYPLKIEEIGGVVGEEAEEV